jgi:hypothetical protein
MEQVQGSEQDYGAFISNANIAIMNLKKHFTNLPERFMNLRPHEIVIVRANEFETLLQSLFV